MADPITLGLVVAVGSALVGGVSAMSESGYKQQVAQYNADIAEVNAERAQVRGGIEAQNQDQLTAAMTGEQEAAQSVSGLSLGSRSAIQTRAGARELGRLDTMNVVQDAETEAFNYRTQGEAFKAEKGAAAAEGMFGVLEAGLGIAGAFAGSPKIGGRSSVVGSSRPSSWAPWTTKTQSAGRSSLLGRSLFA